MSHRNQPISNSEGPGPGDPLFAARLFPHRSLGPRGFRVLMGFVCLACLAGSIVPLALGAWPVVGFLGLDVLLIWLAFRLSYRSGRAFEEVAVWRDDLLVRKHSPTGKFREHRFNPFWARFHIDRHDEIGITRMALLGEGREVIIGDFLNPPDRLSFAAAFSAALAKARGR